MNTFVVVRSVPTTNAHGSHRTRGCDGRCCCCRDASSASQWDGTANSNCSCSEVPTLCTGYSKQEDDAQLTVVPAPANEAPANEDQSHTLAAPQSTQEGQRKQKTTKLKPKLSLNAHFHSKSFRKRWCSIAQRWSYTHIYPYS